MCRAMDTNKNSITPRSLQQLKEIFSLFVISRNCCPHTCTQIVRTVRKPLDPAVTFETDFPISSNRLYEPLLR